ncbi:citrate/2-methylcitrate synthase [Kineococcus sp. LSe6-4]|uniref:Citrate/2-methylcitrate synthase n=1 Tax=Kineococcus halophytocola TaxID=3234027 RepID=A0ABV4H486_9ACTN
MPPPRTPPRTPPSAAPPASALSSAEAAHRLGVRRATLYAYVSRGLLHAHRTPGGSLFDPAEVEALAARGRRRPVGTVETVHSELTSLDDDRLRYRGQDAVALSRTHSFEAVARLLWTGTATPGPFAGDPRLTAGVEAVLRGLPAGTRPAARLRVAVAAAGALLPAEGPSPEEAGPDPEPLLAAVLGRGGAVAAAVGDVLGTPGGWEPALVLLADHGLAVSTVAARVAASARARLPAVLSAALGAADGPLHAGAPAVAHRFLERVLHEGPAAALAPLAGRVPPGFGTVVHTRADPRAEELLDVVPAGEVAAALPGLLVHVLRTHGAGAHPNVDLALAAHALARGLPPHAGEFVFVAARTAGWVAHALEEYRAPALRYRVRGLHGT